MNEVDLFIKRYCELSNQQIKHTVLIQEGLRPESFQIQGEKIIASDIDGVRNAINFIGQLVENSSTYNSGVHSPSFKIRGVIEGFYGTPWTHEQRKRGLIHFAKRSMNAFIFAPKDDPWQRFDWRTPFKESFLSSTSELVDLGHELAMEISVCVSPGLTISYSSKEDLNALLVRYQQLHDIGVRRFGLLLDDIPGDLQFDEDKERFQSLAQAHAELANNVNRAISNFSGSNTLFVCPLQYHGRGHEPYISELGKKLESNIDLMWTGRQICSEYLESIDAKNFFSGTSKRPFYWDNYPVNDVAMVHQLHIGPIAKREKDLGQFSQGLVANPMDRFEASLIPLTTIADYLWDSESYIPEKSWDNALKLFVAERKDRDALRHLFRNCFESCLAVDAAPDFGAMLGEITLAWRTGKLQKAVQILKFWSSTIAENYQIITSPTFAWPALRAEVTPWLEKYRKVGISLRDVAAVLGSATFTNGRIVGTPESAEKIRKIRISLAQDPTRIFGDGLDLVLGELATELSVVQEQSA